MAVKTEKELSESLHALWLKAVSAIELRNFAYAISLLQEILKQEPEFLTGRQLLRRAEVTKSKSVKKSFFNISIAPIGVMKAQREIKKNPKRAVELLEEVLEGEPYNRQANLSLKEAAVGGRLAGDWSFRAADLTRRKTPRRESAAGAGSFVSRARGPRERSGSIQSNHGNQPA